MNPETRKSPDFIPLESLHSDFHVSVGGDWLWNKNPGLYIGNADRKVLFLFGADDAHNLSQCPSVGKIGLNTDSQTSASYPYVGFAYGDKSNEAELRTFAKQFPKAQLIEGLTDTWVSKPNAKITDI